MGPRQAANLFADVPVQLPEELVTVLAEGGGARVERIVSPPQPRPGPWYDQGHDEWVVVLRGRAALELDGRPGLVELGPGDHLILAAHQRHRVAWTVAGEVTVWLAVHYP
jgi:cupin 2 domain-containing protein